MHTLEETTEEGEQSGKSEIGESSLANDVIKNDETHVPATDPHLDSDLTSMNGDFADLSSESLQDGNVEEAQIPGSGKSRYGRTRKPKLSYDFISVDKETSYVMNSASYDFNGVSSYESALISCPQVYRSAMKRKRKPKNGVLLQPEEEKCLNGMSPLPFEKEPVSEPKSDGNCSWNLGDVAWAKIGCHPYWPCIISEDPEIAKYRKFMVKAKQRNMWMIHVTFCRDNGRHTWIYESSLMKFVNKRQFFECKLAMKKDRIRAKNFIVRPPAYRAWESAVKEAESLSQLSLEERIKYSPMGYIIPSPDLAELDTTTEASTTYLSSESANETLDKSLTDEFHCDENSSDSVTVKNVSYLCETPGTTSKSTSPNVKQKLEELSKSSGDEMDPRKRPRFGFGEQPRKRNIFFTNKAGRQNKVVSHNFFNIDPDKDNSLVKDSVGTSTPLVGDNDSPLVNDKNTISSLDTSTSSLLASDKDSFFSLASDKNVGSIISSGDIAETAPPVKRKRGRPRKSKVNRATESVKKLKFEEAAPDKKEKSNDLSVYDFDSDNESQNVIFCTQDTNTSKEHSTYDNTFDLEPASRIKLKDNRFRYTYEKKRRRKHSSGSSSESGDDVYDINIFETEIPAEPEMNLNNDNKELQSSDVGRRAGKIKTIRRKRRGRKKKLKRGNFGALDNLDRKPRGSGARRTRSVTAQRSGAENGLKRSRSVNDLSDLPVGTGTKHERSAVTVTRERSNSVIVAPVSNLLEVDEAEKYRRSKRSSSVIARLLITEDQNKRRKKSVTKKVTTLPGTVTEVKKRGRGRPRKVVIPEKISCTETDSPVTLTDVSHVKRGRPRKRTSSVTVISEEQKQISDKNVRRGRSGTRKVTHSSVTVTSGDENVVTSSRSVSCNRSERTVTLSSSDTGRKVTRSKSLNARKVTYSSVTVTSDNESVVASSRSVSCNRSERTVTLSSSDTGREVTRSKSLSATVRRCDTSLSDQGPKCDVFGDPAVKIDKSNLIVSRTSNLFDYIRIAQSLLANKAQNVQETKSSLDSAASSACEPVDENKNLPDENCETDVESCEPIFKIRFKRRIRRKRKWTKIYRVSKKSNLETETPEMEFTPEGSPQSSIVTEDEDSFADSVSTQDDTSLLTSTKSKSLFSAAKSEKVCQVCEKPGQTVRCRGPCNGYYHIDCVEDHKIVEDRKESKNAPKRGRGRPRKVVEKTEENANPQEVSQDDETTSIGSPQEVAQVNTIEDGTGPPQVNETVLNNTADVSALDATSEETEFIDVEGLSADEKECDEQPKKGSFFCNLCAQGKMPPCFDCGLEVEKKTGEKELVRCYVGACGRTYHNECLKSWPQATWTSGKARSVKEKHTPSLMCPQHHCHTCISDNPSVLKMRASGERIVRCVRCPTSYHSRNSCVPAGSEVLTMTQIICPRHYEPPVASRSAYHFNTSWCFICAIGGDLICCDLCPTSFHAECLNLKPEDYKGGYVCEDCQTGRFPLYGEVVWAKLGQYRWWPAQIMFPNQVPKNILNLPHRLGEFVVLFFGSYNHTWVNRGRVFLFQEGDSGKGSYRKNAVELMFQRALAEAQAAHKRIKSQKLARDEDPRTGLKPARYVKIKTNKPVGNVRMVEPNLSNMTACECDPNSASPCAPGTDCLNRMLLVECSPSTCPAGDRCNNQYFEKRIYPPLMPYKTENRGWGLKTLVDIKKGDFVIEYVGEIIDEEEYRGRLAKMHKAREENYYFLTIDTNRMIDAGPKGNVSRFMNHSCDPNCETQKWTVNGDTRVGLFALKDIPANAELVFNYNLDSGGAEKKPCNCGSEKCSGFIGVKVKHRKNVENAEGQKLGKRIKRVRRFRTTASRRRMLAARQRRLRAILHAPEKNCFVCGEEGELLPCSFVTCSKTYHLNCIGKTKRPEGKWLCPWHFCNVCKARRGVLKCNLCVNSYCTHHRRNNMTNDPLKGLVCLEHAQSVSEKGATTTAAVDKVAERDVEINHLKKIKLHTRIKPLRIRPLMRKRLPKIIIRAPHERVNALRYLNKPSLALNTCNLKTYERRRKLPEAASSEMKPVQDEPIKGHEVTDSTVEKGIGTSDFEVAEAAGSSALIIKKILTVTEVNIINPDAATGPSPNKPEKPTTFFVEKSIDLENVAGDLLSLYNCDKSTVSKLMVEDEISLADIKLRFDKDVANHYKEGMLLQEVSQET